jgi:glycerophosphoryl diester phosphodiesterase
MIETDIRRTRDGVIVCHHDPHINNVRLADMNFFEANRMAEAKGYAIPLLKDLLALSAKRIKLDLEVKDVGYELEIIDLVRGSLDYTDFVMKSFNDSTVFAIKEIDPRITAGLLVEKSPFNKRAIDAVSRLSYEARMTLIGADFLGAEASLVNLTLTTRMRLIRKKIFVWTVNGEQEISRIIELGVDAIITDEPDVAIRLLKKHSAHVE